MGEWEDPFNVLGFVGGVVLASALLPQIYLAHKRKSTADISYMWQAVYIVGLLTLMIYYAHFRLWPVFYPMAFEFSCLMYLTGLKVYYEVVLKKVDPTLDVLPEFDASRSGCVGLAPSAPSRNGAKISEFDMSRSGRVGRVLTDAAARSGRLGRGGSGSSLVGDTSWSGRPVLAASSSATAIDKHAASSVAALFAPKLGGLTEAQEKGNNEAAAAAAAAATAAAVTAATAAATDSQVTIKVIPTLLKQ